MKNRSKKEIILIAMIFGFLIVLLSIHLIKRNEKIEFYATVIEAFEKSALVEPKDENMKQKYEVLEVNIPNLSMNDVIKVEGIKEMKETYPPSINVSEYEYVKKADSVDEEENNTTTTTTTNKIINHTSTTTTTTRKTTTKKTINTTTTTKVINSNQDESLTKNDQYVIKLLNDEITGLEENNNVETFGQKAKNTFIKVVDFIFYDKDINGIYFKDLTDKAKLTIISLTLKLDNLIEKYFPNYKENISSKYMDIKNKLVILYLDKTTEFCNNNSDTCENAKKDFQVMKYSLNITWDFIKNLTGTGISKLKQWYEIYSGK